MIELSGLKSKNKYVLFVGQVVDFFFSYKVRCVFWRYLVESKIFLEEEKKIVSFISFVERLKILFLLNENRKRNKIVSFYNEELNYKYIEHLFCLYFDVFFSLKSKKDFLLKRVVLFLFFFLVISLDVADESNSSGLSEKSGNLVSENRIFPFLSEVESDNVVISVTKKVCYIEGVSLFSELIWNSSYLNFFFF